MSGFCLRIGCFGLAWSTPIGIQVTAGSGPGAFHLVQVRPIRGGTGKDGFGVVKNGWCFVLLRFGCGCFLQGIDVFRFKAMHWNLAQQVLAFFSCTFILSLGPFVGSRVHLWTPSSPCCKIDSWVQKVSSSHVVRWGPLGALHRTLQTPNCKRLGGSGIGGDIMWKDGVWSHDQVHLTGIMQLGEVNRWLGWLGQ